MIVSDTDFLSSFIKIGKLDLVFNVFKTKEITITNAVYDELKKSPIFVMIQPYILSNKIKVESILTDESNENFGKGETESILLAKNKKAKLLMDDREAGRLAEGQGITVVDIPSFLFYCKENKILSSYDLNEIISQLKEKDYYEFEKEIKDELISEN